jgi:hypothetical protein
VCGQLAMFISRFLCVNEVGGMSTRCAVVSGAEGVGETSTSDSACGAYEGNGLLRGHVLLKNRVTR